MTTGTLPLPADAPGLITVVGVLHETLTQTLTALASAHGNTPGPWLDKLQRDVTHTIKNSYADGLSLEVEHASVAAGLAVVQERFQALRLALGETPEDGAPA